MDEELEPISEEHEALRTEVAGALRELIHAFVGHEHDDDQLVALRDFAREQTAMLRAGAHRDRMTLMRRAHRTPFDAADDELVPQPGTRAGFEDRAVAGRANPTSLQISPWRDGETVIADIVFESAYEGAPGRAHGGIVAAAFDDFTGAIIGMVQEPAFTGELTVRFVRPVPVHTPLRFRTWLASREGRKLYIEADAHDGDTLVATCHATYITVDPSVFARTPEPR
jgi:acyl-coenzyme A thioesterase PaaI-like protein